MNYGVNNLLLLVDDDLFVEVSRGNPDHLVSGVVHVDGVGIDHVLGNLRIHVRDVLDVIYVNALGGMMDLLK